MQICFDLSCKVLRAFKYLFCLFTGNYKSVLIITKLPFFKGPVDFPAHFFVKYPGFHKVLTKGGNYTFM